MNSKSSYIRSSEIRNSLSLNYTELKCTSPKGLHHSEIPVYLLPGFKYTGLAARSNLEVTTLREITSEVNPEATLNPSGE